MYMIIIGKTITSDITNLVRFVNLFFRFPVLAVEKEKESQYEEKQERDHNRGRDHTWTGAT